MAEHNDTGAKGEVIAANHLKEKGYEILETNWRFSNLEADIIAVFNNELIIVEVKTRQSNTFGEPETFVNKKKQQNLMRTANEYVTRYNINMDVRFDIISVMIANSQMKINHIENAFLFSH